MATAAARRYARAVFELAQESGQVSEWSRRLARVRDLLTDESVRAVLTNPTIATERRMELISAAPHELDPKSTNLARLLIESNRVDDIAEVADEYQRLAGEVELEVVVDPAILGGLKLQYGDRLVDATIATRLQQLRRRLAAN